MGYNRELIGQWWKGDKEITRDWSSGYGRRLVFQRSSARDEDKLRENSETES